jgi:hypothetical protein
MKPVRMAGTLLGVGAAGAGGYGLNELIRYLEEQRTPMHSQEMTQADHAKNNIGGMREKYSKLAAEELALFEGLRQGMMAGEISGEEINTLALNGDLPPRVMNLLTDVHDWGRVQPYPFDNESVMEAMQGPEAALR